MCPRGGHPRPGPCPTAPTQEERSAYPGAGSRQGLPKWLKPDLLVMAHKLGQRAVAARVPRDEVAPVGELVDDKVPTAVTAPATQAHVTWGCGPGGRGVGASGQTAQAGRWPCRVCTPGECLSLLQQQGGGHSLGCRI